MITCRELADSLCDLVGGELPPAQRAEVEQHLRVCPPCVGLLESYQVTIRLARHLPPAPMPPHLVSRLQAALQAPPAP